MPCPTYPLEASDPSVARRQPRVPAIFSALLVGVAIGLAPGCQTLPAPLALPLRPGQSEPPSRVAPFGQHIEHEFDPDVIRAQSGDTTSPARAEPSNGPRGVPPLRRLLDDSPDRESTYFPEADNDPEEPDIRKPGPDTANFPNSPYTLPQGRAYIEASPVFISGPSVGTAKTYNAEFLLRYGLTDRVELRLFSNGPTAARGQFAANGMAPLAWDLKTNFWKENVEAHIPAVGLEVFVLTPSGSKHLNQGTQPSISLLFDHTLPFGFLLEWNVGLVGDPSPNNGGSAIEPAAQWALQHEIVEGFDVFFQGYFNGPTLPRFGDGVELGGGAIWAPTRRLSIFGSYNAGVSREAPTTIFQLGGAFAF